MWVYLFSFSVMTPESVISDEASLSHYLRSYEEKERKAMLGKKKKKKSWPLITGGPPKNGTVDTVDFSGLCSDQVIFFTLLDRASFPHYYNTKIIKFGWELFILWVISYGLSFSEFCPINETRLMTASAAHVPTHTSIQPATKKSQCQWRAWIVNPCHWTL